MTRIGRGSVGDNQPSDEPDPTTTAGGTPSQRKGFAKSGDGKRFSKYDGMLVDARLRIELAWDLTTSPEDIRLHLAAFLLDADSRVPVGNPYYSVHHDNDRSKDGSIVRAGREQHGRRIRNETLMITTERISTRVEKIVIVAYIQDASMLRRHTFSSLRSGIVTLSTHPAFEGFEDDEDDLDPGGAIETMQHKLNHDYRDTDTAVIVGELIRGDGKHTWLYRDLGLGRDDIVEVGAAYGVPFV